MLQERGHVLEIRLKRTGKINPPWAKTAWMFRRDYVAVWKDASNDRPWRYDEIVWNIQVAKYSKVSLLRRPLIKTVPKALATSKETAPVRLFSPKFLVFFNEASRCKDLLYMGLNIICSSHINLRSLISCKILPSRIFSNNLPIVSKRLMGR